MRKAHIVVVLLTLVAIGSRSFAAERWRDKLPERKMYMSVMVLTLNDVKTELKLTTEQQAAVSEIYKETLENAKTKYKEMRAEGYDFLGGDEPDRLLQAMAEIEHPATIRAFQVLDETQQKRAAEITLQMAGVAALQFGDLAKRLELTEEQRDKIDAAFRKCENEIRVAIKELRGDEERAEVKRAKLARRDGVEAILSDAQRAKYKSLKGEPSPAGESDN